VGSGSGAAQEATSKVKKRTKRINRGVAQKRRFRREVKVALLPVWLY